MKRIIVPLILVALSIAGCTGNDGRPADLPPLFPCEITITQEGNPLVGATVGLESIGESQGTYFPAGITDDRGKTVLSTYGYDGAPAGKYKVTVRKTVTEGGSNATNEYGEPIGSGGIEYRTVETKFSRANTTPHEIEVTKSRTMLQATFDVGKPIKEKKM